MEKRFTDARRTIYDFSDEFLVVCPQCDRCAVVVPREAERRGLFDPRRLVCRSCGLVREWEEQGVACMPGQDWYFHLPLWLSARCCGEELWGFNWRHLQFIEEYVGATLRENARDPEHGWNNRSLANRLPQWMKDAKHRDEVLRAIARLRRERGS